MNSYPKIPGAWWPKIAEENGRCDVDTELAVKDGVGCLLVVHLS